MNRAWLVKSEPSSYSWDDLVREGTTEWTGVRNFTARNNLRAMQVGDEVLFYHSVVGKEIVGIATVKRAAFPDPTMKEGDWSAVKLAPRKKLQRPVTLEEIKQNPALREMALLRLSRLSVQPVTAAELRKILRISAEA
ncbi:MAG: EVE domain-containing protein [Chthoniobacterales bacterium]